MHTLTLIPPTSVRSFKQQLLSTTAFTPTYHKGGIGKVLGVVAAVAIPFAAPTIAASLSISTALGPALSGALVGAGLGAATAAITGQNPLMGAAMGGIGGGISGYMNAPAGIDPISGLQNIPSGMNPGDPTYGLSGYAQTGIPSSVGVQSSFSGADIPFDYGQPLEVLDDTPPALGYAASNPGAQLSGVPFDYTTYTGGQDFLVPEVLDNIPNVSSPPNASAGQLVRNNVISGSSPDDLVLFGGAGDDRLGLGVGTVDPELAGVAPPILADISGGQPTSTLAGLRNSVSGFFNDPMAAIKNLPDYAKYGGVQAGTQALSNLFASKPEITAAEQAALDQRARLTKLEEAKQLRNQALGDQYMQQARAINPVQLGMESAADAAARYRRGINNRNLSGAQLAAARRRDALNQALVGSTAFTQGRDAGLAQRMAGISRAAGTGANYTALSNMASNDLGAAQAYQKRLNQERGNFANMATPLLAGSVFGMTDEELRAQEKRLRDQEKTIKGTAIS